MCSGVLENIIWALLFVGGIGCIACLVFGTYCIINKFIFNINEKNNARLNLYARSIGYVFPYFTAVVLLGATCWLLYLPLCGF